MSCVKASLFGKFSLNCGNEIVGHVVGGKAQELLAFLLLHRDQSHPREVLGSRLWSETTTERSKKYLRQALWQLQSALRRHGSAGDSATWLRVEPDSVQLTLGVQVWLDVAAIEEAAHACLQIPAEALDPSSVKLLQAAIGLYRGPLLEGWYQDWCLAERERLQGLYLSLLDKLIGYCEVHKQFDEGVRYATLSLRHDRARECTHQALMRLYCGGGDRAAALRQYDRCLLAMDDELGVAPSLETRALYEQLRTDRLHIGRSPQAAGGPAVGSAGLADVLAQLKQLAQALNGLQERVRQEVALVENLLEAPAPTPARQRALRIASPPVCAVAAG